MTTQQAPERPRWTPEERAAVIRYIVRHYVFGEDDPEEAAKLRLWLRAQDGRIGGEDDGAVR